MTWGQTNCKQKKKKIKEPWEKGKKNGRKGRRQGISANKTLENSWGAHARTKNAH